MDGLGGQWHRPEDKWGQVPRGIITPTAAVCAAN